MATSKAYFRPHFLAPPIDVEFTLLADAAMGSTQIYDALTGQYTPDYTIVPLPVRLSVSVSDPDTGINDPVPDQTEMLGRVTGQWFVADGDSRVPIDFTTGDFTLIPGETHAIKVCRNSSPGAGAMVIVFAGTYTDGQGRHSEGEAVLRIPCISESAPRPRLTLDVPGTFTYNPLANRAATHSVNATMTQAGRVMTPGTDFKLVWQFIQPGQSSWRTCGGSEPDRAEFTVSAATDRLNMYLPMLVDGTRVRVRAAWRRPDGTWTGAAAASSAVIDGEEAAPEAEFTVVRRTGRLRTRIFGATDAISSLDTVMNPYVDIMDGKRNVSEDVAAEELDVTWTVGEAPGTGSLTPLSPKRYSGLRVSLGARSIVGESYGGIFGVEPALKPPYGVATDADGNGYTDENGNYYIIR